MDIVELRKSLYPNCLLEDRKRYAYSLEENRYVDATRKKICYLTYYRAGDYHDFMLYRSLESDFAYSPIFIFQVVFPGEDLDELDRDPWFYTEKFSSRYTCERGEDCDYRMLTEENFPTTLPWPLTFSLERGMTGKGFNNPWDSYRIITTGEFEDWSLKDDEVLDPKEHGVLVRIIRHGDGKFEVDVNSSKKSYDYEDYWVWFFMIPPSLIPVETSAKLLLDSFKRTYFEPQI